ncbi:hypothetical protein Rhe02_19610 [Rhizocola hellebori]|uniref:Uncharacterized protein n=1 Tax=Rhizocola hellebori TaxID=1392758 RepID=A0A8J3VDU8_9ACTN|nr:hypothetical protein [Rhizocola hellebori]GIH03894.1 hypothetical protein Rhe02_19610 [Rhizocola hellebori]
MALTRRGSRPIVVRGIEYRWLVRSRPSYGQGTGAPLTLAVELPGLHGAVLVIKTDAARPDNWIGARSVVIRPAQVAACIMAALHSGWRPAQPGPAFRVDAALASQASAPTSRP